MKRSLLLLFSSVAPALAHHGQDFLLNYDPDIPGKNRVVGYSAFEWTRESDGSDEISTEPGFLWGINSWIAAGTTVRIADDGAGWGYSGINPMIQIMLPQQGRRWQAGVFAGYLFADSANQPEHSHGEEHIHDPNPGGIDNGPDAPPPGPIVHIHEDGEHGHSHTGIHRHGEDHFQLRLLLQAPLWTDSRFVANLIGVTSRGGDYAFGYSVGLRQQFTEEWAIGVEGIGDFNTNGSHEALLGAYWTPIHECTIRLGGGMGIGTGSKDFSIHSGITWRF